MHVLSVVAYRYNVRTRRITTYQVPVYICTDPVTVDYSNILNKHWAFLNDTFFITAKVYIIDTVEGVRNETIPNLCSL